MRYAFHGKLRDSSKPLDGYIEAPTSSDAIDLLADRGIIGVYSVRADPEVAKPLPAPPPSAEQILTQLVGKMNQLIGHVETLLSRPVMHSPVRNESGAGKRLGKPLYAQDETLRAIFETNLDLRRSLEHLNIVGVASRTIDGGRKPDVGRQAPDAAKLPAPPPRSNGRPLAAKQPAA